MPTIHYFWDEIEDNVVREYDENNNTIASYTTEPTRYGSVLSQDRSGEKRYLHFDGLGNTTELTDEAGNVTDTRRYTGFWRAHGEQRHHVNAVGIRRSLGIPYERQWPNLHSSPRLRVKYDTLAVA